MKDLGQGGRLDSLAATPPPPTKVVSFDKLGLGQDVCNCPDVFANITKLAVSSLATFVMTQWSLLLVTVLLLHSARGGCCILLLYHNQPHSIKPGAACTLSNGSSLSSYQENSRQIVTVKKVSLFFPRGNGQDCIHCLQARCCDAEEIAKRPAWDRYGRREYFVSLPQKKTCVLSFKPEQLTDQHNYRLNWIFYFVIARA